jgi:hypothetical protein
MRRLGNPATDLGNASIYPSLCSSVRVGHEVWVVYTPNVHKGPHPTCEWCKNIGLELKQVHTTLDK